MRRRLMQTNCIRWDLLMGYQGTRVYDDLTIYSSSGPSPATIEIQDSFFTRNKFDGMTMGLGRFSRFGYMSIDTRFKLGMGNLRRQVIIQEPDGQLDHSTSQRRLNGTCHQQWYLQR